MIEVAIVSMEQALVADGASVPEGSGEFEQRPLLVPGAAATAAAGQGASASQATAAPPAPAAPVAPAAASVPTDPPPGT
jgi:hypothetical protein